MILGLVTIGNIAVFCVLICWQPWRPKWESFVRNPLDFDASAGKKDPPRKV